LSVGRSGQAAFEDDQAEDVRPDGTTTKRSHEAKLGEWGVPVLTILAMLPKNVGQKIGGRERRQSPTKDVKVGRIG
jgi:hypothetical protein